MSYVVTKLSEKKIDSSVDKNKKFDKKIAKNILSTRVETTQKRNDSSLKQLMDLKPSKSNIKQWSNEDKLKIFMQVFGKKILEVHALLNETEIVEQMKEKINKKSIQKKKEMMVEEEDPNDIYENLRKIYEKEFIEQNENFNTYNMNILDILIKDYLSQNIDKLINKVCQEKNINISNIYNITNQNYMNYSNINNIANNLEQIRNEWIIYQKNQSNYFINLQEQMIQEIKNYINNNQIEFQKIVKKNSDRNDDIEKKIIIFNKQIEFIRQINDNKINELQQKLNLIKEFNNDKIKGNEFIMKNIIDNNINNINNKLIQQNDKVEKKIKEMENKFNNEIYNINKNYENANKLKEIIITNDKEKLNLWKQQNEVDTERKMLEIKQQINEIINDNWTSIIKQINEINNKINNIDNFFNHKNNNNNNYFWEYEGINKKVDSDEEKENKINEKIKELEKELKNLKDKFNEKMKNIKSIMNENWEQKLKNSNSNYKQKVENIRDNINLQMEEIKKNIISIEAKQINFDTKTEMNEKIMKIKEDLTNNNNIKDIIELKNQTSLNQIELNRINSEILKLSINNNIKDKMEEINNNVNQLSKNNKNNQEEIEEIKKKINNIKKDLKESVDELDMEKVNKNIGKIVEWSNKVEEFIENYNERGRQKEKSKQKNKITIEKVQENMEKKLEDLKKDLEKKINEGNNNKNNNNNNNNNKKDKQKMDNNNNKDICTEENCKFCANIKKEIADQFIVINKIKNNMEELNKNSKKDIEKAIYNNNNGINKTIITNIESRLRDIKVEEKIKDVDILKENVRNRNIKVDDKLGEIEKQLNKIKSDIININTNYQKNKEEEVKSSHKENEIDNKNIIKNNNEIYKMEEINIKIKDLIEKKIEKEIEKLNEKILKDDIKVDNQENNNELGKLINKLNSRIYQCELKINTDLSKIIQEHEKLHKNKLSENFLFTSLGDLRKSIKENKINLIKDNKNKQEEIIKKAILENWKKEAISTSKVNFYKKKTKQIENDNKIKWFFRTQRNINDKRKNVYEKAVLITRNIKKKETNKKIKINYNKDEERISLTCNDECILEICSICFNEHKGACNEKMYYDSLDKVKDNNGELMNVLCPICFKIHEENNCMLLNKYIMLLKIIINKNELIEEEKEKIEEIKIEMLNKFIPMIGHIYNYKKYKEYDRIHMEKIIKQIIKLNKKEAEPNIIKTICKTNNLKNNYDISKTIKNMIKNINYIEALKKLNKEIMEEKNPALKWSFDRIPLKPEENMYNKMVTILKGYENLELETLDKWNMLNIDSKTLKSYEKKGIKKIKEKIINKFIKWNDLEKEYNDKNKNKFKVIEIIKKKYKDINYEYDIINNINSKKILKIQDYSKDERKIEKVYNNNSSDEEEKNNKEDNKEENQVNDNNKVENEIVKNNEDQEENRENEKKNMNRKKEVKELPKLKEKTTEKENEDIEDLNKKYDKEFDQVYNMEEEEAEDEENNAENERKNDDDY